VHSNKWITPKLKHFRGAHDALDFAKARGTPAEYKALKELIDRLSGSADDLHRRRA
jgi:hypothetical protein